jgi:dTMP kinase
MTEPSRRLFLSFEGTEGAGKTTQMRMLVERLRGLGYLVTENQEPGATAIGREIRRLLLDPEHQEITPMAELLLMFASRAQLVRDVVQPALASGQWVLSDRFTDASFAYQGGGRKQPVSRIADLEIWAAAGVKPDLTLLLDLPVAEGMKRASGRGEADRIEMENADFFERVREAYRERAAADPKRFRVIDSAQPLETVLTSVRRVITTFLDTQS